MYAHGQSLIILLAEDEAIIALALEEALIAAGYTVGARLASASAALAWLEYHRPDGAIVDIVLRDGVCAGLIGELMARGIPTLLYSGVNHIPVAFRELALVAKPAALDDVIHALDRLMQAHVNGRQSLNGVSHLAPALASSRAM